jgi:D-lactate dehydrogenase
MTLQEHLVAILPATQVKTKLIDVMAYAADAGFYHLIPKAVVQPTNVQQVKQLFNLANHTKTPLVFRAGGTSLSGQSITDGILVDIAKHWRKINVLDNGKYVHTQPGITGAMVNAYLKPYKRKIGPDPSSISAAMMGGILSNNSSGMCCGVAYNSYHTLQHVHFVLPNGNDYNTANTSHYELFLHREKELAQTLQQLQQQIKNNTTLYQRIRHKYKTKNTVGYSLNALIDFEHPLDVLAHLLIGAEGTLAFIAESTLQTLPALPFTATAMLYFNTIYDACASIVPLKETQADVLELMDRASLRSVENLKGLPTFFTSLPNTAACILCEYQAATKEELEQKLQIAQQALQSLPILHPAAFTQEADNRDFYWKIRKGMFPSVGAVRAKGTTVLLEDVAFPVERLADAVIDLQQLFKQFGYADAIIFGHAKDGNIHFVVTQLLDTPEEVKRYDDFMKAIIELVIHKYDGALKAEHGTGRNMAPFVEAEWGGEAYAIMQTLKQLLTPIIF